MTIAGTTSLPGTWEQAVAAYESGTAEVGHLPRVLCVEPTDGCNFACTSCVRPEGKAHLLDADDLVRWVDREPGPFRAAPVWVHFSGESLLHPGLSGILAVLRERGVGTMLSTNASRLDHGRAAMLLDSGLSLIVFSLDAARADTFRRIRVGGDFDEVERNVRAFLDLRGDRPAPTTQAQLVLGDQGLDEVWEFLCRWAAEGVDTVQLKRYSTRGGMLGLPTARRGDPALAQARGHTPCLDPWLNVVIRADGTVVPCCADFTGQLVLGSLHQQSLAEIWNGQAARALRTAHATGTDLPELCARCTDARTPAERDAVVRFAGLPVDEAELAELIAEYPRHLLFDLREVDL
ncbi:radical SAM/SPASM domain-containing protein [Actinokineospora enzanensis]|uniref:radical SAM/SPASM domain-containing protein n=1 Tax=Actinokineospora enzanensis TaxID=155975 RepID=UPI000366E2F9|nr:radical SAM/SPASM domain-containing protein [Actinokineospora enzanensis]